MAQAITQRLVKNLKLFNAKERDHLMRYAYLGESKEYALPEQKFLSDAFTAKLMDHVIDLGLSDQAKCVFAGMDYHIDWLFVALKLAINGRDWEEPSARGATSTTRDFFKMASAPQGAAIYEDFRALTGTQEDVDLLVVFTDGQKSAVLFVEAKGCAAFGRVQLARKLIRLDRVLVESGVLKGSDPLIKYRLILASPNKPNFDDCRVFACGMPKDQKYDHIRERLDQAIHASGLGNGVYHLEMPFPGTYAVTRTPPKSYEYWELKKR